MDRLWAPWRLQYIKSADRINEEGCIFCDLPAQDLENDRENLILQRAIHSFIIMNKFPYNGGHLMIVPYKHTNRIDELNSDEKLELMNLLEDSMKAFENTFEPHGYNIGMNLGRIAGAGIQDHLHYHIVPRWNGDTNFMPVIGETKVISVGLNEVWETLYKQFNLSR